MRSMPTEVGTLAVGEGSHAKGTVEAKQPASLLVWPFRHYERAVVENGDQSPIEDGVEVWGEQQAVVDVEALGIFHR